MKFILFFLILLVAGIRTDDTECRADSDCSDSQLCVNGNCLHSNHASGRVVITDKNNGDECQPECSTGQKCVAGICTS